MADFTKTISNSVNFFAGEPSSKWGEWAWGSFKWGYGTNDLPEAITHLISESISPDSAVYKQPMHLISESLSITGDPSFEGVGDGSGYYYGFVSNTDNAENRASVTYTSGTTAPGNSYSSQAAGSTSWSEQT